MAQSSDIGATASRYTGDAGIGGGSFGAFKLDVSPILDLAKYTMLYNKAEYDQRQKDAESAAKEIADMTSYDLTSGIPKDAKLLQEKYDKLTDYVSKNPNALDYKNKKEWTEYKKMRNDLENDLKGGKVRNIMWSVRQKEVQDETNPDKRKLMQEELDKEIADTDIRTPIKHSQQYQDNQIKLPTAPELTFDVTKTGPNAVVDRKYSVFNVSKARANGDVFALGLDETIDPSTPQAQRDAIGKKNNFWLQGAEAFNSVINAKDQTTGDFLYKTKKTDAAGNVTYDLDESKLSKLPRNILNLVKQTNEYLAETKNDIKSGLLLDKFEKPITFGDGALDENDYAEINYKDGLSPEELALVAQYASWKGDTYTTESKQTDNALQASAQALTKRGQDINHQEAVASLGLGYSQLEWQKMKDGWTKDGKTWIPPTKTAVTSTGLDGVVPYWENNLLPQISKKDYLKSEKLPSNYSGDVKISTEDISGLSIALLGELDAEGKQLGYTKSRKVKIRYENGTPIGVVIEGIPYAGRDINSKATIAENKSVANKLDKEIYPDAGKGPVQTTTKSGLPVFK